MTTPDPTPPRSALPPYFRHWEPPRLPPCPACGGVLVQAVIRRRLELYCAACPWNPDTGEAPEIDR